MSNFFDQDDWQEEVRETLYEGFSRLERVRFNHALFEGGRSGGVVRECLHRQNAVAVLLYDPQADAVVLVEQIRVGALEDARTPWLLEIVAGLVDPGEAEIDVALRESQEEAGCTPENLFHACSWYPSPGAMDEVISLYVGAVDSTRAGGVHGLPHESEDIRVRVVPRAKALELLLAYNAHANAVALIALLWLDRHLDDVRKALAA
jgi:ADP-ribose pyrophosphatase